MNILFWTSNCWTNKLEDFVPFLICTLYFFLLVNIGTIFLQKRVLICVFVCFSLKSAPFLTELWCALSVGPGHTSNCAHLREWLRICSTDPGAHWYVWVCSRPSVSMWDRNVRWCMNNFWRISVLISFIHVLLIARALQYELLASLGTFSPNKDFAFQHFGFCVLHRHE